MLAGPAVTSLLIIQPCRGGEKTSAEARRKVCRMGPAYSSCIYTSFILSTASEYLCQSTAVLEPPQLRSATSCPIDIAELAC